MGSVYVSWKGVCHDRAVQEELVGFLHDLAERSVARLEGPVPARPAFQELMTRQRKQTTTRVEPIRTFDEEITGRIVLDPCLTCDGQALWDEVQRKKPEIIPIDPGGTDKEEAFCLMYGSGGVDWCLGLSRLRLYGIDYQLFDPRGLYPSADRMSFVFLESPELSSLGGALVQVENREQCQPYRSEVIRSADWYVSAPEIHLRYYLEEWSDFLLSWVKYFFLPDLRYHRYEDLSQYEAIGTLIEEQCRDYGHEFAKQAVFLYLLKKFEMEADEWIQRLLSLSGD